MRAVLLLFLLCCAGCAIAHVEAGEFSVLIVGTGAAQEGPCALLAAPPMCVEPTPASPPERCFRVEASGISAGMAEVLQTLAAGLDKIIAAFARIVGLV